MITQELKNIFDKYGEAFMHEDVSSSEYSRKTDEGVAIYKVITDMGYSCQNVEHYGGEGQGETYYNVMSFTTKDGATTYVRFNGWYQSYYGSEYSNYEIVTLVEKTVTFYEAVK